MSRINRSPSGIDVLVQESDQFMNKNSITKEKKTHVNPNQAGESMVLHRKTTAGQITGKLFFIFFFIQLILIGVLNTFLTIRGFVSDSSASNSFHPLHWYLPLLTSIGCSVIASFSWLLCIRRNPSRTIKAAFWLSPSLTVAAGMLLIGVGTATNLAVGAAAIIFALIQSLYACWVVPWICHTSKVSSITRTVPTSGSTKFIALSIFSGAIYSCLIVSGLGGINNATGSLSLSDALFVLGILFSLAWTMQVIRNITQVSISRIGYLYFAHGIESSTSGVYHDTIKYSMGNVCLGSAVVPVLGIIRNSAKAVNSIQGDTDEFLFSCANCYSSVAARLVGYGNRWGFVHVGAYNKGFVQASMDTWEMIEQAGLESVTDTDLTGSFCFFCGVAVGAACLIVSGSWTLAIQKDSATQVSIYAFLIGYFMCRIAMAWPQASMAGYYVAYSENPQSLRFDSTIPDLVRELQRSRD